MILPIFLLNEDLIVEAIMSNELPGALPVMDEGYDIDLDDFTEEISVLVPGNHDKSILVREEKYILYPVNNAEYKLFKIVEMVEEREAIYTKLLYAEISAQTDLIEDIVRPFQITNGTIETVMNKYLESVDWELGDFDDFGPLNVEVRDYPTVLQGIRNFFADIKAEVSFTYEVEGTTIKKRKVNVYKKLGNELGHVSFDKKDLQAIRRNPDTRNLVTAMVGVGPETEGGHMNLANFEPENIPEGFTKLKYADWVGNDEALSNYSNRGKHRVGKFVDTEAQSQQELFVNTVEALKKYMKPQVKYEASIIFLESKLGGLGNVGIGSKLFITDKTTMPMIILEARIRHLHTSIYNPSSNSVELGDYIPIEPVPDDIIRDLQETINKNEQDWNASKWRVKIESSAGTVFKNGEGETTLKAVVYKGPYEYDSSGDILTYTWEMYDKNGNLIETLPSRAIKGKTVRVLSSDFDEKIKFKVKVDIPNP